MVTSAVRHTLLELIHCGWNGILDIFYPHTCSGCGYSLADRKTLLCSQCESLLPRTEHAWQRGNMVEQILVDIPLAHSLVRGAAFGYYEYDTPYRDMIHTFKYRRHPQIGEYLGQLAAKEFAAHGFFDDIDLLVPVPLHKKRLAKRGYNQAEVICDGISKVTNVPIDTMHLFRAMNNTSQTKKTAQERQVNTDNIFTMQASADWKGKHILLVDDIITTGATLRSAMQAMKGIRGLRVSVFTLGITHVPVVDNE